MRAFADLIISSRILAENTSGSASPSCRLIVAVHPASRFETPEHFNPKVFHLSPNRFYKWGLEPRKNHHVFIEGLRLTEQEFGKGFLYFMGKGWLLTISQN
jgi:hypothetical protein